MNKHKKQISQKNHTILALKGGADETSKPQVNATFFPSLLLLFRIDFLQSPPVLAELEYFDVYCESEFTDGKKVLV